MAAGLAVLATVALSRPAVAARGSDGGGALPRCIAGLERVSSLAPYASYLAAQPHVLRAFNPCQYPSEILSAFQSQLAAAASTGLAPSVPLPASWATRDPAESRLLLTRDEGYAIIAARLAHILFVEVGHRVPWSIASYDDASLARLFGVCAPLGGCTFGRKSPAPSFYFDHIADHSPRAAWDLLQHSLDWSALADPATGVHELLGQTRDFRHGSASLDPVRGIATVAEMAEERVSRRGCWSMVAYLRALAGALNIPTEPVTGYFSGAAHRTLLIEMIDGVLAHGDDPYDASLDNTPSRELLDSYARWEVEVLAFDPMQGPTSPGGFASRTHNFQIAWLHPSVWIMARYCGYVPGVTPGRSVLETFFGAYATSSGLDDLEARIREATAQCTVIPPDSGG